MSLSSGRNKVSQSIGCNPARRDPGAVSSTGRGRAGDGAGAGPNDAGADAELVMAHAEFIRLAEVFLSGVRNEFQPAYPLPQRCVLASSASVLCNQSPPVCL